LLRLVWPIAAPDGMIRSVWRREPFRLLFPLGVALAWVGIGHWIAYWAGWIGAYSCLAHGLVQIQGFLLAFALGFLLTALPRRTESAPPPAWGLAAAVAALVTTTAAAFAGRWWMAEGASIAVVLGTVVFAVRRFAGARVGRRPPAPFVLIPIALACNVVGGVLVAWGTSRTGAVWGVAVGRLLVEQGLFLCLVMGAGALVLPLMAGAAPPADIGSSPEVARQAVAYTAAGVAVVATLVAEARGSARVAPIVRGVIVAVTLAIGAGARRGPMQPGWNRRVAWLAVWLIPTGILLSGLLPDYRVPALHVTFVGGFGLLAFAVGTHVTAAHLDLVALRDGRSPLVAVIALASLVALLGRVTADATQTYFEHLAAAAAVWIAGSAIWLVTLAKHWFGRRPG
jgi:uncharacterized protein involved in response to NO